MSGHTPGPWQYSIADNGSCSIWADHSKYVIGRAADECHAKLIAAAPAMLEALRAVAEFWAGGDAPAELTAQINAALDQAGAVVSEPALPKWRCPACKSTHVQISLPTWYHETTDELVFVETDAEADIKWFYCADCDYSVDGEPERIGE
jgi:hypothetical protein